MLHKVKQILTKMIIDISPLEDKLAQLARAIKYTNCSLQRGKTLSHPTSVLDMTLNNLMVKFQ